MSHAHRFATLLAAALLPVAAVQAQSIDEAAAQSLMKKSGCFKGHSLTARKDGPSFLDVAAIRNVVKVIATR
jgi:cytochrome c551/c552